MYAHNGKGFDSLIVKNDPQVLELQKEKKIKFASMVKNSNGVLSFVVKSKKLSMNFQCTLSHIQGSLKNLCKSYAVPESICKDDFDILSVNP